MTFKDFLENERDAEILQAELDEEIAQDQKIRRNRETYLFAAVETFFPELKNRPIEVIRAKHMQDITRRPYAF